MIIYSLFIKVLSKAILDALNLHKFSYLQHCQLYPHTPPEETEYYKPMNAILNYTSLSANHRSSFLVDLIFSHTEQQHSNKVGIRLQNSSYMQ